MFLSYLEGKVITSANFLFLLRFLLIQLAIKLFMFLHSSDLLIEIHCNVWRRDENHSREVLFAQLCNRSGNFQFNVFLKLLCILLYDICRHLCFPQRPIRFKVYQIAYLVATLLLHFATRLVINPIDSELDILIALQLLIVGWNENLPAWTSLESLRSLITKSNLSCRSPNCVLPVHECVQERV